MRDPDAFDAFYRDAGERLLLQTYALTGDLTAARSAVRDSFIVAWHHWRRISRLGDPEAAVRPHAWRHAQRRHTARLWHRDKMIDPDVKATLDALATLTVLQRKALLLTQLASVSMPEMAREIGVPLEQAERELQSGAAQFALARDVSAAEIPLQFEGLSQVVSGVRFPRPPIVRR
ncbi:MAG: polymerase sigma factor, partial [Nocardioides sp.]|nr:polymerase sigma factor [Nocardioides sp.]